MTTATPDPVREYLALEDYLPTDPGPMPELGEPGADPRERWKRIFIDGWTLGYEISDYGRVINPKGQLLAINYPGSPDGTGWIGLTVNGKSKAYRVDKLVLAMFADAPSDITMVPLHINGDKKDARLENLVWVPESTLRAQSVAKGLETRKANQAAAKVPAKPRRIKKRAPAKQATKRPTKRSDTVEVTRLYRFRDLALAVGLDGSAELTKGSNSMRFTPEQFTALVTLTAQAAEMNALLGLK